jgi:hypothetical protein
MNWVIHRANTLEHLHRVPKECGVEIDLRASGDRLIMHHDPFVEGTDFDEYLEHYDHGLMVLNIKEAGIETEVLKRVRDHNIQNYFLLDVEFPYIYRASRQGVKEIAMRYSEDESIENTLKYKGKVDWVWIDTNTKLPLNEKIIDELQGMKTCLVCPERWGRPQDIPEYAEQMKALDFWPDAVMTSLECLEVWKQS